MADALDDVLRSPAAEGVRADGADQEVVAYRNSKATSGRRQERGLLGRLRVEGTMFVLTESVKLSNYLTANIRELVLGCIDAGC